MITVTSLPYTYEGYLPNTYSSPPDEGLEFWWAGGGQQWYYPDIAPGTVLSIKVECLGIEDGGEGGLFGPLLVVRDWMIRGDEPSGPTWFSDYYHLGLAVGESVTWAATVGTPVPMYMDLGWEHGIWPAVTYRITVTTGGGAGGTAARYRPV